MNVDKDNWKELDINVDSLWMIDSRAKGGKRSNSYHGNFVPQIPNEMIRRYTEKGDTVLDMFMGSGTTLFECESLERNFIGFDINDSLIEQVNGQMTDTTAIDFKIHNCDITDSEKVTKDIEEDLKELKKKSVDLIISHPPYMDIIQFTDKEEDLSHIQNLNDFIATFTKAVENCFKYLGRRKYFVLVIGDVYKNSEVVPLGFYLMYAIKKHFPVLLKGIVVKNMAGNRAKIGSEGLWRYRALRNGNYIFKHEYVFVFQKK